MFRQHMLATMMPHGVLFRGGAERAIRASILKDDLLEAVISLPPNLFYGTGIPACIMVLRAPSGHGSAKPLQRRGKVLFINADAEYYAGRAQNFLRPEYIEKIVSTFDAFCDIPGYARVVELSELAENDYNLNIRRYADNAHRPNPHDVRAHLLGGVPAAEIEAMQALFVANSLDTGAIFVPRQADERYFDFAPALTNRAQIKPLIETDPGVQAQAAHLREAFDTWWQTQLPRLEAMAGPNPNPLPCKGRGKRVPLSFKA